jgi:hypothetical protein
MSNILNAFNDHFIDFLNDVQSVFPNDPDILSAKNALNMVRRFNPKMIVKIWKTYIADKYRTQIEAGDISFFLSKDYSCDISNTQNSDKIMESINRLREPINNMGHENKAKVMKYIQNLTNLADMVE